MVGVDVCEVYNMYMCLYIIYSLNDSWLKLVYEFCWRVLVCNLEIVGTMIWSRVIVIRALCT